MKEFKGVFSTKDKEKFERL